VLLAVNLDGERGSVDNLLSNTDVALLDEHTGVVDGALDDLEREYRKYISESKK
jgi:hypothetical protein